MIANKRGAIELSITTIVVVVIGVTLLVLGLTFVSNIFRDIGQQQKKLGEFTDEQIRDIFARSDQFLNLPTTDLDVDLGKAENLDIVIKNNAENVDDCVFDLELETTPVGSIDPKNWITFSKRTGIRVGKAAPFKVRMQIKPLKTNAQLGDYLMTLALKASQNCDGFNSGANVGPPEPITIRVR